MMCPQCGSTDLRLATSVWLATSIDDPDNHEPDLPEHQCMACGLAFWCGLDMASLTEPDFSADAIVAAPCVRDNKMTTKSADSWVDDRGVSSWPCTIPEGFRVLTIATCSCAIAPYDVWAHRNARTIGDPLKAAGLDVQYVTQRRKRTTPTGSGPGGRVRFGDAMLPPNIHVIVPDAEFDRACVLMTQQVVDARRRRDAELAELAELEAE